MKRTEGTHLFDEGCDLARESGSLRGGSPNQTNTRWFNSKALKRAPHQLEAAQSLVVLFDVMTFSRMTSGNHHAVCAVGERLEHEGRIEGVRAHQADQTNVGRIFDASGPGQIRSAIGTPVAGEADDGGFKLIGHG